MTPLEAVQIIENARLRMTLTGADHDAVRNALILLAELVQEKENATKEG